MIVKRWEMRQNAMTLNDTQHGCCETEKKKLRHNTAWRHHVNFNHFLTYRSINWFANLLINCFQSIIKINTEPKLRTYVCSSTLSRLQSLVLWPTNLLDFFLELDLSPSLRPVSCLHIYYATLSNAINLQYAVREECNQVVKPIYHSECVPCWTRTLLTDWLNRTQDVKFRVFLGLF